MDQQANGVEAQNNEKEPRTTKNKVERWHPETGRYPVDESDDKLEKLMSEDGRCKAECDDDEEKKISC